MGAERCIIGNRCGGLRKQLQRGGGGAAALRCGQYSSQSIHQHTPPNTGALLGNFSFAKGVELACRHEKDDLVWEALVSLPWQPEYRYK